VLVLAPGRMGEPLRGELVINTAFINIPTRNWGSPYVALSYCWAGGKANKVIYLQGKTLRLTQNLWDALQHIRSPNATRNLWVDQICIDQESTRERNEQVQQMDQVYTSADSVIAWLGNATTSSEVVIGGLSKVDDQNAADNEIYFDDEMQEGQPIYESMLFHLRASVRNLYPDLTRDQDWLEVLERDFKTVVANSWFSRMWIIQEATLPRNLILQAGDQKASWRRLYGLYEVLNWQGRLRGDPSFKLSHITSTRIQISRGFQTAKDNLLILVSSYRNQRSTEPRDSIYALIGLARRLLPNDSRPSIRMFKADYSLSMQKVWIDFAIWHIQAYRDLDPLARCCVETRAKSRGLPSWVKDWSQGNFKHRCLPLFEVHSVEVALFKACNEREADAELLSTENVLAVPGIRFDVVEEVVVQQPENDNPASSAWLEWKTLALKASRPDPYKSSSGRWDAFWRTLIKDRGDNQERAPANIGKDFQRLMESNDLDLGDGVVNEADSKQHNGFGNWIVKWNSKHEFRKLFRTRKGYLGISCEHVRAGDIVSILWGGRLPFLLRESKPIKLLDTPTTGSSTRTREIVGYKLIGGYCYVHGICDGEALDLAEHEGIEPETIHLV
jgi:hypothetical protein